MTVGERQRLVAHLEMTEAWLDSEVSGLSDAQLKFKMTPESWSVEEVVMHLAIAEPQYWDQFKESLAKPVQPDFKPQATDAGMLWYGIDRTQRTTTGEARVPRDQFPDMKASLASFKKLRGGDDEDGERNAGRSARPAVPDREPGSVSVVPDDLDALAAAHPADQGSESAQGLSEEINPRSEDPRSENEKAGIAPGPSLVSLFQLRSWNVRRTVVERPSNFVYAQPLVVPQLLHL